MTRKKYEEPQPVTLVLQPPEKTTTKEFLVYKMQALSSSAGELDFPEYRMPRSVFGGNKTKEREFSDYVEKAFLKNSGDVVSLALWLLMADSVRLGASQYGRYELKKEDAARIEKLVVSAHISNERSYVVRRIRAMMGMPRERERGQHSKWTEFDFREAIIDCMKKFKPHRRTQKRVWEKMVEIYSDKAPSSLAAFKRRVSRYKLKWEDLQAEAGVDSNS